MWWFWWLTCAYPLYPYAWYLATVWWDQKRQFHHQEEIRQEYTRLLRQVQLLDLRVQALQSEATKVSLATEGSLTTEQRSEDATKDMKEGSDDDEWEHVVLNKTRH